MILTINTTQNHAIEIQIKADGSVIAKKKAVVHMKQAEKLLIFVDDLLKRSKIGLRAIKKIRVANGGGSFTSLRIGVATANALGFALGIPVEAMDQKLKTKNKGFSVVEPIYNKEPNITVKNN